MPEANQLVVKLDPSTGIRLIVDAHRADLGGPGRVELDLEFAEQGGEGPTPYEVLLHAALVGNPMRFTRQDAVEETWRVFQPLLDSPSPVHPYAPGSWGPEEWEALVAGHGSWHGPWIAEWANRQDWSASLVTAFVRQAEQKLNAELRIDRMINFADNVVTCRCSTLPDDWLEFVSDAGVKFVNPNGADGFLPLRYKARDEFFELNDNWAYGYYTIQGRQITFGGRPDQTEGVKYRVAYFGEVPVFADTIPSWVYSKYPNLYLFSALMHADLHAVGEENSAANLKSLAEDMISKLNADHLRSKASGSRITRSRIRSFG